MREPEKVNESYQKNSEKSSPTKPQKKRNLRIPETELERIKQEISVVELVEAYGVKLKRQGKNLIGLCPFHKDSNCSLSVSREKNLWNCLGACQKGGTVIDWVMCAENVSFRHAVELLREKHPSLYTTEEEKTKYPSQSRLKVPVEQSADDKKLLQQVIEYYHQTLLKNPVALEYLRKRGIGEQAIKKFKIGFADRSLGLRLPKKACQEGKALRERLKKLGILRESGHEHLNGSVVIPVINRLGEITEVYGRKINNQLRKGTPYHLYLPGPHKGVFNVECLEGEEVIICEALIDAISVWETGNKNVTSSYGTGGFTEELLESLVKNEIKRVYLASDPDEAGNKAAEKIAVEINARGIECYRMEFPNNMDANEFICNSKQAAKDLENLLRTARRMGEPQRQYEIVAEIFDPKSAAKEKKLADSGQSNGQTEASEISSLAAKEKIEPCPKEVIKGKAADLTKDIPVKIKEQEIEMVLDQRHYRIRGFDKNLSFDSIRVNIRVFVEDRFHVDTLELYNARQRYAFIKTAAQELGVNSEIIKRDIGRILLKLEQLQEQQIHQALNPKPKEVILTDKEINAALGYLKAPNLLDKILDAFRIYGLVGEEVNSLMCYLALTSRKLDEPLTIIIQALSSAGKSALMKAALSFIPEEEVVQYTAMTGQSLFYMGEENLVHKVLAISEEEGAEKAAYPIKIMQSEKSLCIASTGKDPKTGRFITHEYNVKGPVQIILTTTSVEIDEELQNRCIVLTVNEARAQTREIHRMQRERETLQGMLIKEEVESLIALHQNAQRLLKPIKVVNPYATQLTFLDSRLRMRRDHVKYLTLIRAIALLHQYQRPIHKKIYKGNVIEYIEVTREDIATANRLVNEVMGTSLDELSPQTRRFLELLAEMVAVYEKDPEQEKFHFTRKMVRDYTGWSDFQVRTHLKRLVDLEYVLIHSGSNGQRFFYELIYHGEGKENNKFLMGLVDVKKLLSAKSSTTKP